MARMHILCIAFASGHLGYIIGLLESEAQDERSCWQVSVSVGRQSSGIIRMVRPGLPSLTYQHIPKFADPIHSGWSLLFFGTQPQHRWGTVSLTFGGFEFGPSAVAVWWSSSKCLLLSWLWENSDWYGDMKHQETGSMMGLIWIYMDHHRRRRHHHHHDDYCVSLSSLLLLVSLLLRTTVTVNHLSSEGRKAFAFWLRALLPGCSPDVNFSQSECLGMPQFAQPHWGVSLVIGCHRGTPIAGWFIGEIRFINGWFGGSSILGQL